MDPRNIPDEKQVFETTDPELAHIQEKEAYEQRPSDFNIHRIGPGTEQSPNASTGKSDRISFSKRTLIIISIVLVLVIGGLVGGLAGGLTSKQNKDTSPPSTTASTTTKPGASTTADVAGTATSRPSPSASVQPSTFTIVPAPGAYPRNLSSSNLVQNPVFAQGFQYWSDTQHCWQASQNPSGGLEIRTIARVYNNQANPGVPCKLSQTIASVGAGAYTLNFQYGTYFDTEAKALQYGGGTLTVRAGGQSSPATPISNIIYSIPGRYDGFAVGSFQITTYESDFLVEFAAWSNGSVWDISNVQLIRS